VKTRSVWSTQISCLNDHSEFRFSVRLLRDEIKQYIGHADEHIRFLAQHMYETLENDGAGLLVLRLLQPMARIRRGRRRGLDRL
jgi:hypothetical protein